MDKVLTQIRKALADYEQDLPKTAMIHWTGVDPEEALLVAYLERVTTLALKLGRLEGVKTLLAIAVEDFAEL